MAPRKSVTPSIDPVKTNPLEAVSGKRPRQRHAPVNIRPDLMQFDDVEPSAVGRIPTNDALLAALDDSFQRDVAKSLPTVALSSDYKTAERVIRHHATVAGVGVSIRQQEDRIVFRARKRRQRKANSDA